MNILEKLAEIANELDKKGLYAEASEIDGIIKSAEGFREQLAPGLLGPEDPTKMPPGAGAGGISTSPEPSVSVGPDFGEGFDYSGESGKGETRSQQGPVVASFQEQYNDIWNKLKDVGLNVEQAFGPQLDVDAIRGPRTMRAERLMPRLQAILQNELRKQPKSKPGFGVMPETKIPPEVSYPEKTEQPAWGHSDKDYPVKGPWS